MVKLLYNILHRRMDSPYLFSEIHISLPTRASRPRGLFSISKTRTNILHNSPMEKGMKLCNRLIRINRDIFFNTKYNFEKKVMQALTQLYPYHAVGLHS